MSRARGITREQRIEMLRLKREGRHSLTQIGRLVVDPPITKQAVRYHVRKAEREERVARGA
jgi:hypothetical protein